MTQRQKEIAAAFSYVKTLRVLSNLDRQNGNEAEWYRRRVEAYWWISRIRMWSNG